MTRHCEHVKSNGHFCGSPAMRNRNYCYSHLNYLGRKLRTDKQALKGRVFFELPLLEDASAVQLALMQVTNALLLGTIDPKRAGLVLYALQTASSNLRNIEKESKNDGTAIVCNSYDSFEEDYDLEDHPELRVDHSGSEDDGVPTVGPNGEKVVLLSELSEPYTHRGTAPKINPETGEPWLVLEDPDVRVPLKMTKLQYYEAMASMFQYELDHGKQFGENGKKPVPQRPAISQKVLLGLRKPPQPFTWPEDETSVPNESVNR